MQIQTIVYYFGYCLALVLYKDMGRLIFVPMLANMWFNLLITFDILRGWDFRWLAAIQGILFFIWVLALAQVFKRRFDLGLAVVLLAAAFFLGTLPDLTSRPLEFKEIIEATTRIWTVWDFCTFVIVVVVVVRSTIVARIRHEFVDVLTNPKKRVVLPIGLYTLITAGAPLFSGVLSEYLIDQRYNIASHVLVWGWVALELPFYIMYERLRRRQL